MNRLKKGDIIVAIKSTKSASNREHLIKNESYVVIDAGNIYSTTFGIVTGNSVISYFNYKSIDVNSEYYLFDTKQTIRLKKIKSLSL